MSMTGKWNTWVGAGALTAFLLCSTGIRAAQTGQQGGQSQPGQQQQQPQRRTAKDKAPDAVKQLDKAELYSKRAIEITPTLPKPENLTDEAFSNAKNDTLSMAHSGLGLVYIRRGKFSEAIPELEQSVKSDTHPDPDPVNYYLLAVADQQPSHFDPPPPAFSKCASVPSSLQAACKSSADEAKKQGSTQLSAPN